MNAAVSTGTYSAPINSTSELIGLKISSIQIVTTRVDDDVVRARIRVQEGDRFESGTLDDIRLRLNQARLFKKVTVSAEKNAAGNGVIVYINLWDGWFIVPFPFITSGDGGLNASLLLVERNYFRKAESISMFGGGNRDGAFGSVNVQLPAFSVIGRISKRDVLVWSYADGGFNTTGRFRSSRSEDNPERFGAIANQYKRKIQESGFEFRRSIFRGFSGALGFSAQRNDYEELALGALPADSGNANALTAGVNWRIGSRRDAGMTEAGFSFGDLGAMFGFGMADLEERIKPLASRSSQLLLDWGVEQSDRSVGSDFNFTKISLGVHPAMRFLNRQVLSLRVKGVSSAREDLPLSQRVATNRDLALRGNYAREYRGDRGVGSSLGFSYPFRRTRLGAWTAETFVEGAGVWQAGRTDGKSGFGFGLSYQFWRFPLPIGFVYSHSWDDGDGQINAAIGGRF